MTRRRRLQIWFPFTPQILLIQHDLLAHTVIIGNAVNSLHNGKQAEPRGRDGVTHFIHGHGFIAEWLMIKTPRGIFSPLRQTEA